VNEFDFIRAHLAPLASGAAGARGLRDDAATLQPPPGCELVVTADTLVAGVHFRPEDPLDGVAGKALRVNLSDLAAKGAIPLSYMMCVAWPRDMPDAQKALFVEGLARDQALFDIALLGGDTVVTPGPLTVSITALGFVKTGRFVSRSGARVGDQVFVTGTIGDAGLGLAALGGSSEGMDAAQQGEVIARYQTPQPRMSAASALCDHASAAIDVSDGLLADAGHVAACSGVQLRINASAIPLSPAARAWTEYRAGDIDAATLSAIAELASSGDDYELLFCGDEGSGAAVAAAANIAVTPIGAVVKGSGVVLADPKGELIPIKRFGFTHF